MAIQFKKATREQSKLRMAIDGPAGSGKTYTALRFAFALASSPDKVAVVDTEAGSASKYVGENPDGIPWQFDAAALPDFNPQHYIDAIHAAEEGAYEVLVLDSISHAWEGEGGALEIHDKQVQREPHGNSYTAWRPVTKVQNEFVQAMLQSKCHIIATMRSRMEYVQDKDERTGKTTIRKVGMAPVQRQGMEYEFDVIADMDIEHSFRVTKTRCTAIDGAVVAKPGPQWFAKVRAWLLEGAPAEDKPKVEYKKAKPAEAPKAQEQPAPKAEAPAHWIDDQDTRTKFFAWATGTDLDREKMPDLGLTKKEVYDVLGVPEIHQYAGTVQDASHQLAKFAKEHLAEIRARIAKKEAA